MKKNWKKLSGNAISNRNRSANMLRSKFYVCPVCGNVVYSTGELTTSCHGLQLIKLYPEGVPEVRIKMRGVKKIFCYCNKDGLFYIDVKNVLKGKA